MKKIALAFVCCLFLITGCSNDDKDGKVVDITTQEAIKKIEDKDDFVLIVSLNTCPHCEDLKEMLNEKINQHETTIYRVELVAGDKALNDNLSALKKHVSMTDEIPHIFIIKGGKEIADTTGYDETEADVFWNFIKENGMESAK